jgi:hypothetical protein
MLWQNKNKHLHDMSQTVGLKRPLNEGDVSAAPPFATASILETITHTDPSEVDGPAASPIATANILEETTNNTDPNEVDGSAAPRIATASILEPTTNTQPTMDSFLA